MTNHVSFPLRRAAAPPFGWLDVLLALTELGAFLIGAAAINEPGNQDSVAMLLVFGIPLGICQLFLRRNPLPVLLLSVTILSAYHIVGGDPVGMTWTLLIPYAVSVRFGNLWPVVVIAGVVAASTAGWRILIEGELAGSVGLGEALALVTVGLAIALGEAAWQRARYMESAQLRIRQVAASVRAEAERQIARHRLVMAADLHDIAGHSLVAIGLQLNIADETLYSDPSASREAIATALRAHRQALHDITAAVRFLREEGHAPTVVDNHDPLNMEGLENIADLAGLTLEAAVHITPRLSPERSFAIARILQEALTNTIRHANAAHVSLTVREDASGVDLEFQDNGRAATGPLGAGYGIRGMRERAAHLGGRLDVKREPDGSIRITAWIPLDGASS